MTRGRRRRDGDEAPPATMTVTFRDQFAAIAVDETVRWERVHRSEAAREIALLLIELARPCLVRVVEDDGAVFADVLTAPVRDPASVLAAVPVELYRASVASQLVETTGEGFLPGEDVEVAPVLQTVSARGDGVARALLDSSEIGATGVVLLLGATSGTVVLDLRPAAPRARCRVGSEVVADPRLRGSDDRDDPRDRARRSNRIRRGRGR